MSLSVAVLPDFSILDRLGSFFCFRPHILMVFNSGVFVSDLSEMELTPSMRVSLHVFRFAIGFIRLLNFINSFCFLFKFLGAPRSRKGQEEA